MTPLGVEFAAAAWLFILEGLRDGVALVVLVVFAAGVVCMPWFLHRVIAYTLNLWSDFHRYLG